MKTKPNDAAFNDTVDNCGNPRAFGGLTKREYFAAIALQGFLGKWPKSDAVILSVKCADQLIEELNKGCPNE